MAGKMDGVKRARPVKHIPTNQNKREVRERVLAQLRQLRLRIEVQNPGLLGRVQEKILPPALGAADPQRLVINRKKNLQTVMMFMTLRQDTGSEFAQRLKTLLAQVTF